MILIAVDGLLEAIFGDIGAPFPSLYGGRCVGCGGGGREMFSLTNASAVANCESYWMRRRPVSLWVFIYLKRTPVSQRFSQAT